MVIVYGFYEISELVTGCIGCVLLYIAGCNVMPLQYVPDLPAVLFVLSAVIVLHRFRWKKLPPILNYWQLVLEVVALYITTQVLVAFVWELHHALLDASRDAVLNTRLGLIFLKYFPKVTMFMRQDVCYMAQLGFSVMVTMKALSYNRIWNYFLPGRFIYRNNRGQDNERGIAEGWERRPTVRRARFNRG